MAINYDSIMTNYQTFNRDYFAGSDVYIAFNNVPIDEIIAIEFTVQEPIIPIYGYASYTYDAVAHGARLVNGSFRINFKEAFYIRSAMTVLSINNINSKTPKSPLGGMSAEEIAVWMKGKSNAEIEKWKTEYEQRLWGFQDKAPLDKYENPFFANKISADGTEINPLLTDGFDIIISYGDQLLELGQTIQEYPSTVKVINGVHLTSVRQVVQPTGEPVYEEYTFIGKDVDNTLVAK